MRIVNSNFEFYNTCSCKSSVKVSNRNRMSDVSLRLLWRRGTMEACYKLYTWINNALLMLLVQLLWKMSQITDYFNVDKSVEDGTEKAFIFHPLSKEFKIRRHIRSMSDVQSSTPYVFRSRKGSTPALVYDSDSRARRIRAYNRHLESSGSSDCSEISPRKLRSLDRNILKHTDSMRIL